MIGLQSYTSDENPGDGMDVQGGDVSPRSQGLA